MGMGLKMLNPTNYRNMANIVKISSSLDKHMKKRCAYCDLDMGLGTEFGIVEFVKHLAEKHPEQVDPKDIDTYKKIVDKVTR